MARRRSGNLVEAVVRAVFIAAILGYAPLIKWWNDVSVEVRILLVTALALIILSSIGLLLLWSKYRKEQRALAWKNAMTAWSDSQEADAISRRESARFLTDRELEEFAEQVYRKMGYKVKHTGRAGDHGVDVYLVSPKQEVELVQCKQWRKRVGEPQVRDLYGAMMHMKAVRGWLWAPGGFSEPARRWAKSKPIVLVDDEGIGRLVESAYQS